jgi:hypothetical protein
MPRWCFALHFVRANSIYSIDAKCAVATKIPSTITIETLEAITRWPALLLKPHIHYATAANPELFAVLRAICFWVVNGQEGRFGLATAGALSTISLNHLQERFRIARSNSAMAFFFGNLALIFSRLARAVSARCLPRSMRSLAAFNAQLFQAQLLGAGTLLLQPFHPYSGRMGFPKSLSTIKATLTIDVILSVRRAVNRAQIVSAAVSALLVNAGFAFPSAAMMANGKSTFRITPANSTLAFLANACRHPDYFIINGA